MIGENKVLTIIPARGGSKGIPKKNIVDVGGKPLIYYSIKVANESELIDRVIVSTDDREIAKIAETLNAEVPFIRPKELAQDNSPTYPVIKHALEWFQNSEKYTPDLIVILEPTFPLRTSKEVDDAIELISLDEKADSLRGVCEPFQNPFKMWKIHGKYLEPLIITDEDTHGTPRQNLKKVYWQNGFIYICRYGTIMEKNSITGDKVLPFVLGSDKYMDLDTIEDLELLKCYMKK